MERHDEQQQEKPHKRRIHYSGRYPRHFAEKYKELNPEKYGEEIAHVRAKGNTPAGRAQSRARISVKSSSCRP